MADIKYDVYQFIMNCEVTYILTLSNLLTDIIC